MENKQTASGETAGKLERRNFFSKISAFFAGGALAALTGKAKGEPQATLSGTAPRDVLSQDGMLGEVKLFAGTYAPLGWAFCEGQLLSTSTYTSLFMILGTQFGGNGTSNFALPDLRGRTIIGAGQGIGLSYRVQGQTTGLETVALSTAQLPSHNHPVNCASGDGSSKTPVGNVPAVNIDGTRQYATSADSAMNSSMIESTGSNTAHSNIQPSLVMRYIICISGTFPSRS